MSFTFFSTLAFCHTPFRIHCPSTSCTTLSQSAISFQPALQGFLLRLAHMDFDSSGLLSTELFDKRQLTSKHLHTPNSSHSLFNQNASLLPDRMRDTHMTPDSSPMVSAPTIVCASISSFYPFRTYCPLLWSFALAVHQMNSCWPVGMPPTFNCNL